AGVFAVDTSSGGSDGQQGDIAWAYALSLPAGGATGLTSGGQPVLLSMDGAKVVGMAGTTKVFEISVNAAGSVTVNQYQAVSHTDTGNPADNRALGANLVTLTATARIEDRDGDFATHAKAVDLGNYVVFTDHGPSIGTPVNAVVSEKYLSWGSAGHEADAA